MKTDLVPAGTSKKLDDIAPFRVMELLARANELEGQGFDVIHMEVGEPDFQTPSPIIAAGLEALRLGKTRYTDARGDWALRTAIARHYQDSLGADISPERIFVTAGASGGLLLLTALLMNPGENLLMTDPGYPCNRHFLSTFSAEGRLVPVTLEDNYQLTPHLVDQYWNSHSRGILVASPANPTGSMLTQDEFRALCDKVTSLGGFTIADEIYQGLSYTDHKPASVLSVSNEAFVVNSFSKYFGMTGWRLGWVVVPEIMAAPLTKLAQNLFICPSSIAQHAALAAFSNEAQDIMEAQREQLRARRDFFVPALQELGFRIPRMPDGAFYAFAGLPDSSPNGPGASEAFCHNLLETQYVAITPGTDFGFSCANDHVRLSYAQDMSKLQTAIERLGQALC